MLIEGRVTITAAVPTVWLMLLQYLEQNPQLRLPHLDRVVIGGGLGFLAPHSRQADGQRRQRHFWF